MNTTLPSVQELGLLAETSPTWIEAVLADFDAFLLDHAAAERKASAMAMAFVVQYPDKQELHLPLIRLAREELLHFQQVVQLIQERGLQWRRDEKDPYIRELMSHLRNSIRERLLDRLLLGAVIEARGVERFGLIGVHHPDPQLRQFYDRLAKSEANHTDLFHELAAHYFQADEIAERTDFWRRMEARAMRAQPPRAALH